MRRYEGTLILSKWNFPEYCVISCTWNEIEGSWRVCILVKGLGSCDVTLKTFADLGSEHPGLSRESWHHRSMLSMSVSSQ